MNFSIMEITDELWAVAEKILPVLVYKGKGSLGGQPKLMLAKSPNWDFLRTDVRLSMAARPVFQGFRKFLPMLLFLRNENQALTEGSESTAPTPRVQGNSVI